MDIMKFVLALMLSALLAFLFIRGVLNLSIDYLVNRSRKKKTKKGQTIKEWFFFTRFREILPTWMFYWHNITLLAYMITAITEIVLFLCGSEDILLQRILYTTSLILILPGPIILCFCVSRKQPSGFDMSRILAKGKRKK